MKASLRQARLGAKRWREYGALANAGCVAELMALPFGQSFQGLARLEEGETVVFSWVAHRSRAAVTKGAMPFDVRRYAMGGFDVMVGW